VFIVPIINDKIITEKENSMIKNLWKKFVSWLFNWQK